MGMSNCSSIVCDASIDSGHGRVGVQEVSTRQGDSMEHAVPVYMIHHGGRSGGHQSQPEVSRDQRRPVHGETEYAQ